VTNEKSAYKLPRGYCKGADGKLHPQRHYDTTLRDAKIIELHDHKKSMRAIAAAVGCSVGTVHRVIKFHGIWAR
jgi:hypothetical protein